MTKFLGIVAALVAFAAGAHAQTAVFIGSGSSTLFLEAGQAVGTATLASPAGLGAVCLWSQSSGLPTSLTVTDSTSTESGSAWIAWTPGTANNIATCNIINTNTKIYAYVQTDSTVGNRLYFNGGAIGYVSTNPVGSAPSGMIFGTSGEQRLNSAVLTRLLGATLTAAGTDIRPEDAKFATLRANTYCGSSIDNTQYLGLGYTFGTSIESYYSGNTVHVGNFTLPMGGYTVIPIGATPIVFAVNPSNTTNGFGAGVSDVSSTTLARFLNGTYGSTSDLPGAAGTSPATVLIDDLLEGDYNAVEYSMVDTTELKLSQDVGVENLAEENNCGGTPPLTNPMHLATADNINGYRNRVIGTNGQIGQAVGILLTTKDTLGYSFWSTENFKFATPATIRYLTVNGYDPLYNRSASNYSTTKNTIPTTGNGYLPDVTFTDINNGKYPAWSVLRIVTATTGSNYTYANELVQALQGFMPATAIPDFIPVGSLEVWRSHFVPPGVTFSIPNTPNNGNIAASLNCGIEAGGDVGGAILDPASCTTGERQ